MLGSDTYFLFYFLNILLFGSDIWVLCMMWMVTLHLLCSYSRLWVIEDKKLLDMLIALACLLLSLQLSTLSVCIFIWFWAFYVTMQDAINSASTVTQTLGGELLEGQRKLLSLAAAGANPSAVNPLVSQLSNGPLGGLHEKVCTVFLISCWFFKPIMWRSICGYQMSFLFFFFCFPNTSFGWLYWL